MREWVRQRSLREQLYLLVAAGLVVLYLLYALAWRPLASLRDDLIDGNQRAAQTLERVQLLSAQLQRLQSGAGAARGRNLSRLINSSTTQAGIVPTRMQASSGGSMLIRFESVSASALLRWLYQVELRDGMLIADAAITQTSIEGLVDASIRLGPGQ